MSGYHIERQTGRFNTQKNAVASAEQIKQNKTVTVEQPKIYKNTIDSVPLITIEKTLVSAEHDKRTLYTPPKINFLLKSESITINKEISRNSFRKAPLGGLFWFYIILSILFAAIAGLVFYWTFLGILLFGLLAIIFAVKAHKIKKKASGIKEDDRKFYWASIASLISLFVFSISLILSMSFWGSFIAFLVAIVAFLSVIGFSTAAFPETKGKEAKFKGFAMALISLLLSLLTVLGFVIWIRFFWL